MNLNWKKILPHVYAVAIFLIVALIYCKPALEGKVLQQSDVTQFKGMSKDIYNYKETHGEAPLWTNGMFSGMPSYLIATKTNNHLPYYFSVALSLFLNKPFHFFFLACICFYFLSQVLRTNSWIGVAGSLAYAYATYHAVIVGVGHDTKMMSLGLLPGFIAAIILIYQRRYLWGAALTALFTGALIAQNHYQIVYYGIIIAFMMTIGYAITWFKSKEFKHMAVALGTVLGAGLLGVFMNAVVILPNYEYTKETIRGGSALATETSNLNKEGLSKDYAFSYSMNIAEPFALMVPRIFGGSSNHMEIEQEESKAVEALQSAPQQVAQNLQSAITFYWGEAHTSGPPYAGAIICCLAIIGFVVLDDKHKWWILATIILTIMMSWGGFFESFNTMLFKVLPMYNKFRAPGMIMVVPTLLVGMMAILTMQKILFDSENKQELLNKLKKGLYVTGGVFVVLLLIYFNLEYKSASDDYLMQQIASIPDPQQKAVFEPAARQMLNGLIDDRKQLFLNDLLRSFLFISAAAAALWLYHRKVLKPLVAVAIIGALSFIDIISIDSKYLNSDNYLEAEESEATFLPTAADQQIMADKSYYRVLNVVGGNVQNSFNHGALASYFHKSIGGYHPAKLSIYQDLIENQLYKFPNCQPVLNMLNTKYFIYGDPANPQVQQNPDALGAAWFVNNVQFVNTPQEEMKALDSLDVKNVAVANKSFSNILKSSNIADSAASIQLVKNDNDIITYTSNSSTEKVAVFSEVFYDKGWNAYIDGKETPIAKVNYVLRGLTIPAGQHKIEFKFEPSSFAAGWTITNICSILVLLLLAAAIYTSFKKSKNKLA